MTVSCPFVLCADDFALAPGVSRGIVQLLAAECLSATGCMTLSPFWPEHARWLEPFAGRVDIGLHLTLTNLPPLAAMPQLAPRGLLPPLSHLMARAFLGLLPRSEIIAEIHRQIEAFITVFGRAPDFIDGHQHVHLLPIIAHEVVTAVNALAGRGYAKPWVRLCDDSLFNLIATGVAVPKAVFLAVLTKPLRHYARRHGLTTNTAFRGVRDFSSKIPFFDLMSHYRVHLRPGSVLMVHPGIPDEALRAVDPLVDQRQEEYDVLRSAEFRAWLLSQGLRPTRLSEALNTNPP